MNRREFLQKLIVAGATAGIAPSLVARETPRPGRKLLIVQFGGGTRYDDTIGDPDHRFIPRLWQEMVPHGTLFTNMRVEGKVVHPNSTGSMMTGHWEWDDLDWTQPVAHPTLFEIHRRATGASDLKTWAFVYASILSMAGESSAAGYGSSFAANVVEPPTIPRSTATKMDQLMAVASVTGGEGAGVQAAHKCATLARSSSRISRRGLRSDQARDFLDRQYEAWRDGTGSTSHDAFLTDCAIACMKEHSPDILAVCFGEIDCAHYGSWSRYVDALRRTDELTWRLWKTIQDLDDYRDQTLMLVLPDHGRELDATGGMGFVHHSDFYTDTGVDEGCRRVWMVALGPGVPVARVIEDAVPITTVAASGLEFLGHGASAGAAESIWSRMRNRAEVAATVEPAW